MGHAVAFVLAVILMCSATAMAGQGKIQALSADSSRTTAESRIGWDEGVLEVKAGAGADPRRAYNADQARIQALRAARTLALRKLAEVVEGVQIDGTTVVRSAMLESSQIRQTVQARIQGARVVREEVSMLGDGSFWAEVTIAYPMAGKGGLAEALAPWLVSRPASVYTGLPGAQTEDRYTGLIIDASGTDFSPALAPRVLAKGSQQLVYGPQAIQLAVLERQGIVGYAASLTSAMQSVRVGRAPLIVRAFEAAGDRRGDLVISPRDAERIVAADRVGGFLAQGAVIVVLGAGPADHVKAPGQRHALVIGVGNYPRTGTGTVPPLEFAARDADAVADVLGGGTRAHRQHMTLLRDGEATRARILDALRALRSKAAEEDVVVVFFSGHGTTGQGPDGRTHYYLIPHDGRLEDLSGTALRDDVVEELASQIPAKQVVVLLDTCFSGQAGLMARVKGSSGSSPAQPAGLFVEAAQGRVVISASRPDQPSIEDPVRKQGVFTSFLVEALAGGADLDRDGRITVLEAFQYVSGKVSDYTRQQFQMDQQPVLEVRGMSGEIVLTEKK